MDRKGTSRNDPCPCGSGKKYKNCCLPKGVGGGPSRPSPGITDLHGKPKGRPEYPVGTVQISGPSREVALTKMRDELQYRSEWCPCSGASADTVELQVSEESVPTGQR